MPFRRHGGLNQHRTRAGTWPCGRARHRQLAVEPVPTLTMPCCRGAVEKWSTAPTDMHDRRSFELILVHPGCACLLPGPKVPAAQARCARAGRPGRVSGTSQPAAIRRTNYSGRAGVLRSLPPWLTGSRGLAALVGQSGGLEDSGSQVRRTARHARNTRQEDPHLASRRRGERPCTRPLGLSERLAGNQVPRARRTCSRCFRHPRRRLQLKVAQLTEEEKRPRGRCLGRQPRSTSRPGPWRQRG